MAERVIWFEDAVISWQERDRETLSELASMSDALQASQGNKIQQSTEPFQFLETNSRTLERKWQAHKHPSGWW